jgi:hypothetical protein
MREVMKINKNTLFFLVSEEEEEFLYNRENN